MNFNLTNTISGLLPFGAVEKLRPILERVDHIISGDDKNAVSQRTALTVFIIRVASALIAFLSQVLLARWMGTFEYGIFVAVWVAIILLGTLSSIGFPSAVVRFVAEYREKNAQDNLRGVIVASLGLVFLSSSAVAAIGSIVLWNFPQLVTSYYVMPIFLAAVCLPMLAIQGVLDGIARAFEWPKTAFLPTFIFRPIGILLVLGFALAIGMKPNAEMAMWAAIIASYASSILQFAFLSFKLNKTLGIGPIKTKPKFWIIVALPVFLVEGFYVLLTSIDILFVSSLMGPKETAIYFASTKILALVHFVYFAVRAAVSHHYAAYHTAGNLDEFRQYVQKTVSWTFWPSLLMALFMGLFSHYFLCLFGKEFVEGTTLVWILALGIVFRASVGPAESLLVMTGKQNICALVYAGALFANVALNLSLIPAYGLNGAAIATTIALAIESMILHVTARRMLSIHAFVIPEGFFKRQTK